MGNKLSEPIKVGNLTFKNRIMFPPLTTGYEERDGSIGARSLNFYERLAKGGAAYVVIGDVAPVRTASPTPKLYDDSQIPVYKNLADTLHKYDCKLALQLFHPEYDVPGVGRMIMEAGIARQAAAKAQAEGNAEEAKRQAKLSPEEKAAEEQKKKDEQIAELQAKLLKSDLQKKATASLEKDGYPVGLAELLDYTSEEAMEKSLSKLTDTFKGSLQAAVESRLRGKTPAGLGNAASAENMLRDQIARNIRGL